MWSKKHEKSVLPKNNTGNSNLEKLIIDLQFNSFTKFKSSEIKLMIVFDWPIIFCVSSVSFDSQFQSPNFVGLSLTEIQFDWIRLSNNAGIAMHVEQITQKAN